MIELLVVVAGIWLYARLVSLPDRIRARPVIRRLHRSYRTRQPPRGEACHVSVDDPHLDTTYNPVKRAEMSEQGISLWYATGVPFRREQAFVPWSVVTDSFTVRDMYVYPGWLRLRDGLELSLDWNAVEIIRELGIELPSSDDEPESPGAVSPPSLAQTTELTGGG
ncbi:MAG: hypothetical protein AAGI52_12530 [Bacteroidota bacterium]